MDGANFSWDQERKVIILATTQSNGNGHLHPQKALGRLLNRQRING